MNTKETINEKITLLLNLKCLYNHSDKPNYSRIIYDCIKAIERGEKYEQMWKKHKKEIIYLSGDAHYKGAKILMERIEQKYFPKGGK